MAKFLFIVVILFQVFLTGCIRTYFQAVRNTSPVPVLFNHPNEQEQNPHYIGMDYSDSPGGYDNEQMKLFRGKYTYVNTSKYTNFNFGLSAYAGTYKVSGMEGFDGVKSFQGFMPELSLSVNTATYPLQIGTGARIGVNMEFGEYYDFRRRTTTSNLTKGKSSVEEISPSVYALLNYNVEKSAIVSLQINFGIPGYLSPLLSYSNHGIGGWISWFPTDPDDKGRGDRIVFGMFSNLSHLGIKL